MTDINPSAAHRPPAPAGGGRHVAGAPSAAAGEAELLVETVELFFFAYRDFTGEADEMLAAYGFGRAHHRVLHFVNRRPGLRVADLLDILKITKQSLARVLKQLVDEGFIVQRAGDADRRERLLYATDRGGALARELVDRQMARIGAALAHAGPGCGPAARRFLAGMIAEDERARIERLIGLAGPAAGGSAAAGHRPRVATRSGASE